MFSQQALAIASTAVNAALVGFLPAVIWLWFWLKEDPHPEPRRVLIATFFAGMLVVPVALFLEETVFSIATALGIASIGAISPFVLFLWAAIEEYVKYFAAKHAALKRPAFDEPVDAPIYLITAAIGFAALENLFFLIRTYWDTPELGVATGQMRFLGATLLHVVASATVGMSIAFSFFHKEHRGRNVFFGLCTASALHWLFNLFIINSGEGGILKIFGLVWVGAIIILLAFEWVKKIKN